MSKQHQKQSVRFRQNQRLRTYKDSSFVSNNQSNNHNFFNAHPQTVDFEQYLYTEHFSPSQEFDESLGYRESETSQQHQSDQEVSQNVMDNKKILIEMGQNYTFADQMSSHRKGNQRQVNLKCFPQLNKKLINLYPLSQRNTQNKPPQLKISSASSFLIPSQSVFSSQSSSKEISLSDNEQDQGVTIYKTKQIEEEMFLKISEQTKEILKLQEKVDYFQDFCKRLLKSEQQSSKIKNNLAQQLKTIKKKSKAKTYIIKQLEAKLSAKEKQIQQLKQSENQIVSQYRSHQRTNSLTRRQVQQKTLLQKQNFQNITLIQSQNKIINQKYHILLQKYQKIQTKTFDLQRQLLRYKKDHQTLKKKNVNIQNMNKILQKEISELNIQIFQLQEQMEKVTYDKYASNLVRIKNFKTQGFKKINLKKSPLITEAFQTTGPLSFKRN